MVVTSNDRMCVELGRKLKRILDEIACYDSNTFCAEGCALTEEEIVDIATYVILPMWDDNVDGAVLSRTLDYLREEANEQD